MWCGDDPGPGEGSGEGLGVGMGPMLDGTGVGLGVAIDTRISVLDNACQVCSRSRKQRCGQGLTKFDKSLINAERPVY